MVIGKTLLTEEQIRARIKELADRINADYKGKEILAVGILKGAFMFYSDLVRQIRVPLIVDFIVSSSYEDTTTTGKVNIHIDTRIPVTGRDVIIIEDIIDTGISLSYIKEKLLDKSPNSLKICVLLDKKERRLVEVDVEYAGFEIPDEFIVGYGTDYNDNFRNLPYVATLKHSG
ncbi:hypoxanthine phosphoribosyltransferase [Candidatus Magnetominusculus dajiuhuensis]|uniref:hypoxanthine phosphoribosyltransferase n=1 Tax=Candidatus Magnetominusculus dajiuhuensis TaxID=3137712 RepID=UPI003B42B2A6